MSGAEQEASLRLVPLMEVAPDASQRSHFLVLAAKRPLPTFYISMPPGKVAYADNARRGVHDDTTGPMQRRAREAKRMGSTVIAHPIPCRNLDFLALALEDVRRLMIAGSVRVQRFVGGLKAASGQGVKFMPAALCLRSAMAPVDSLPLILDSPEHEIRVELRDVLLDLRVTELLTDPTSTTMSTTDTSAAAKTGSDQLLRWNLPVYVPFEDVPEEDQPLPPPATWSGKDDPFNLRSRAPGVFVLYVAAKHFFGSEGTDPASQRAVADWIKRPGALVQEWISTLPGQYDKLANKTNTRLAYKLLDPEHDERKDSNPKSSATPLSGDALGRAWKYRDGTACISERFSLVLLAVDYWQELLSGDVAHDASRIPAKRLTKYVNKLFTEVKRYGFITKEEMHAVVKFVIWPYHIPELEKLKAASQAPRGKAKRSH